MRQIFSSQRVETVEGVAELLRSHGIEVKVTNGRSYKTRRRGQFSYAEPVAAKHQPAVWIRKAEDQPRARDLLRKAGLLATTRSYADLPTPATEAPPSRFEEQRGGRWAWRVRIGLLVVIAAVAVIIWLRRHPEPTVPPPATPVPATTPAETGNKPGEEPEEIRVRIPSPPPGG